MFANRWLHDIQSGDVTLSPGKSVQDYINDYKLSQQDREIAQLVRALGVDPEKLREILAAHVDESNINEYGRFDDVIDSVDYASAAEYLREKTGKKLLPFKTRLEVDKLLRHYIVERVLPSYLEEGAEGKNT